METFAEFVAQARERFRAERDALVEQRADIDSKIEALDREAASFYEQVTGQPVVAPPMIAPSRTPRAASSNGTSRRGSKREGILAVIRENPAGLQRGEILQRMGVKEIADDKARKSAEMSVSNALTALLKGNQVIRADGKYQIAA